MSAEAPPYNQTYIKAWTLLTIIVAFIFLGMFVFGTHLLEAGRIVWTLIRWLASPII